MKENVLLFSFMKLYKKPRNSRCWRRCEEMVSLILVEVKLGIDPLENSLAVLCIYKRKRLMLTLIDEVKYKNVQCGTDSNSKYHEVICFQEHGKIIQ